jgi:hypothetical protein
MRMLGYVWLLPVSLHLTVCGLACVHPDTYNLKSFKEAFSVVIGVSCYLPSASCFALLPLLGSIERSGSGTAVVDYDSERDAAVLVAMRDLPKGSAVAIYDDRPNGELLLSTGRSSPAQIFNSVAFCSVLQGASTMSLDSSFGR